MIKKLLILFLLIGCGQPNKVTRGIPLFNPGDMVIHKLGERGVALDRYDRNDGYYYRVRFRNSNPYYNGEPFDIEYCEEYELLPDTLK